MASLQKLIGFKPPAKAFVQMLGFSSEKIFYTRAQRDSYYSEEELVKIEQQYGIALVETNNDNCLEVDYYPEVFGSCGGGAFALSETKESISIPKNAFWEFSSFKRYSVINAVGSSMSPSIIDRDKLIIEHWDNEQIKDDRVYVFCYKDEIFVKRLIKNIDEIIVKSDNPDPMYRPRYIEGEDMNNVIIVGQVVGIVRDLK
jgi:phage repressor protein C with HTH and peptisase S24 domain